MNLYEERWCLQKGYSREKLFKVLTLLKFVGFTASLYAEEMIIGDDYEHIYLQRSGNQLLEIWAGNNYYPPYHKLITYDELIEQLTILLHDRANQPTQE